LFLTRKQLSLDTPGNYTAKLSYYNGSETVAHWLVRDSPKEAKAKNVLLFIGDGQQSFMSQYMRL